MFRITRAEEQAMRLAMRLAAVGSQRTLTELANDENLPEPTVAKLLGMLRRGGVVETVRGRLGGYILAAEPDKISAASILSCISEIPAFGYPCLEDDNSEDCPRGGDCGLRPLWRHIGDRMVEVLENICLADLLQEESTASRNLQHMWPLSGD